MNETASQFLANMNEHTEKFIKAFEAARGGSTDTETILRSMLPSFLLQVLEEAIPPIRPAGGDSQMNDEYYECTGWNACRSQILSTLKEMKL